MRLFPALALSTIPLLAFGLRAGTAHAIEHYEGLAYAKKGGQLLYRESHWIQDSGQRLVLYRCPGGAPFARKKVMGAGAAPDFEFFDARSGYREGVRTQGGVREVFTQASAGVPEQAKPIARGDGQVIDAGFDAYVRQQWDALAKPERQRIAFLVPSRLQAMSFQLSPLAQDKATRSYKLALDAWYGGVLPNIVVTYSTANRQLMKFEGIGNIRDAAGKYTAVRIEFPDSKRNRATGADLSGAAAAPLVRSCAGS
jgi:hypothetical protein